MTPRPGKGLQSVNFGDDVTGGLKEFNRQLRANRKRVIQATQAVLEAQIVEELSTPGRGKVRWNRIKVRRKGKSNRAVTAKMINRAGRASAPGDPPAPDEGVLRNSIHSEYDDTSQKGRTGTNSKYAAPLNYGTARAGKNRRTVILPRPFMEPALKKSLTAMTAAGASAINIKPIVKRAS